MNLHGRWRATLILLLSLGSTRAQAGPSEQVPVGPRGIAMGGAYTSLAQDASAMFWNPAGLARIGHQEITGTYANLFQSGVEDVYAAFVLPISRRHAFGIDWYRSGFEDAELEFGENRIDLTYSTQIHPALSAGLTAKYLTRSTGLDGSTLSRGNGVGVDLGVLATPWRGVRAGLVAQDLFDTRLGYSGGASTIAFPRNVRLGASYTHRERATIAADVDDRWHLGLELRPLDAIALRGGWEDDRNGTEGATLTTGLGLKAGIFRLDYAYVIHPTLSATSHFGFALDFNFNPSRVRIEKIETDDVFASLYKTYARTSFGSVVLRNLDDEPLDAQVTILVPDLMDAATERKVTLPPGAAETIELRANFSDKAMATAETFRAPLEVTTRYKSDRLDRTDRARGSVVVYPPGSIDWSRGLEQTAAFITVHDPVVDSVASRATLAFAAVDAIPFGSSNVANAAAIFDALTTLGVHYVADQNDPYRAISDRAHAVDRVNYPRQTLQKTNGDCDDTTVLLAALLGKVGIATKLVDVPGHLFLLFDTGRHERDRRSFGVAEDLLVVSDEGLWIPIETTALKDGFATAWRMGAERYATSRANQSLALVDVTAALSRFAPSIPPSAAAAPQVDLARLGQRLAADADTLAVWRARYIGDLGGRLADVDPSPEAEDVIARVYYMAGDMDEATRRLERAVAGWPRSARTHNNLANARAARADWARAVEGYERALALDGTDAGVWLNLGLVRHASGDPAAGDRALGEGLRRSGGYAEASALLGLPVAEALNREGIQRPTAEQARSLLRATLGNVALGDSLRPRTPPRPVAPRALRPLRLGVAGTRGDSGEGTDMRSFLYWRERE